MDIATLITAILTSIFAWPIFNGLHFTPDQTAWLSSTIGGSLITVVHILETKWKSQKLSGVTPSSAATIPPAAKMLALFVLIGSMVSVLPGCATTASGTSAPPSFNQLIDAASQVNNTAVTTLDSLVKSHAVSSQTALSVEAITDKVQAALTLANTAFATGNQTTAQAKLVSASAALAAIQGCLTNPTTLVVCLQGVTAP